MLAGKKRAAEAPVHAPSNLPSLVPLPEQEPDLRWVVLALCAVALLPRALVFPLNENFYGDAVIRTELAERWLQQPRWISSFDDGAFQFGPLHIYVTALVLKVWPAREHAGRLVSLLFGTLSVVPLFFLTRRLFGWRPAVWAGLAFSAWGIHLQVSTTAASEALSLFLVLTTLSWFAAGMDEGRLSPLAAAAAVLNLACATRYDAWMLVPILCAALLLGDRDRVAAITRTVFFGLLCLPFPLIWMQGNELARGSPFFPLEYIDAFHRNWFQQGVAAWGQLGYRLQNFFFWPGAALFTLTPPVAVFGFAGMVHAFRKIPSSRWLLWVAWLPTAYFTVRGSLLGNFVPLVRFTVAQVVLVLPFVAVGFAWLFGRAATWTRRAAAGVTIAVALAAPAWLGAFTYRSEGKFQDSLRPASPISTNPHSVRQVARYLKEEVAAKGEAVILDHDPRYLDLQVAFFSGLPEERMARYRWTIFRERLKTADPRFLVLIQGGKLASDPDFQWVGDQLRFAGHLYTEVPGFSSPFRVFRR